MKYQTILCSLETDYVQCVLTRGDRNRRKFDFQAFVFNGCFSPMMAAMALFIEESLSARDCAVSSSLSELILPKAPREMAIVPVLGKVTEI